MTCKQMGGPCEAPLHGSSADEIMAAGAKHIQEAASSGDEGHKKVLMMMEEMKKNPDSEMNKQWAAKFNADFTALPED